MRRILSRQPSQQSERAIRHALELVDAVKNVQARAPLRVRIGIASGPVVVGETDAGDRNWVILTAESSRSVDLFIDY